MSLTKEFLCFGYVRLKCKQYIPSDIVWLILNMYGHIFTLSIDGELMDTFKRNEMNNTVYNACQLSEDISLIFKIWPKLGTNSCVVFNLEKGEDAYDVECDCDIEFGYEEVPNSQKVEAVSLNSKYRKWILRKIIPFSTIEDLNKLTFYVDISYLDIQYL